MNFASLINCIKKNLKSMLSVNGIIFLVFSVLILLSFLFHADGLFSYRTDEPVARGLIQMENGKTYSETTEGLTDGIRSFRIRFSTNDRSNNGTLTVRITDNGSEIQRWEVNTADLADNGFYTFSLSHPFLPLEKDAVTIELKNEFETGTDNNIAVCITDDGGIISSDGSVPGSFVKQWTLINQEQSGRFRIPYFILALFIVLLVALSTDFSKTKWYAEIILAAAFLVAIRFVDYDLLENINSTAVLRARQTGYVTAEINTSEERTYDISVSHSSFTSLEFFTDEKPENLYVELYRTGESSPLYGRTVSGYFADGKTSGFGIALEVENGRFEPGDYTLLIRNDGDMPVRIHETENGDLNAVILQKTYIAHILLMTSVFILAASGIFIGKTGIRKLKMPALFLSIVIPLSFVYLLMFAPWSQPDTGSHYLAAYRFSNIALGVDEGMGRKEDADFYQNVWGKDNNPSLLSYSGVVHNLHVRCREPELVSMPREEKMDYYSVINYLPETIALTLGRILNLNTVFCIYLSRILVLTAYIAICYYAVSKTPLGKGIIALTALLPMSLMMASAISYDPLVIAVSLAFISSILALKKDPDSVRTIVGAAIWAVLLGALKGGGYVLLLPLAFTAFKKDRRRIIGISAIILAGLVSFFMICVLIPQGQSFQYGEAGSGKMHAVFALQQPLRYLDMCIESYVNHTDKFMINTGGSHLAWLEWSMPDIVIMALFILGGVYSLFEQDGIRIKRSDKAIMLLIMLIAAIGIPAMLLSWTKLGSTEIDGIQGRYFLPVVPLFLTVLTKRTETKTDNRSTEGQQSPASLWGWFYLVSVIGIYFFVRIYLTR